MNVPFRDVTAISGLLHDMGNPSVLSREDEQALFVRLDNGDETARDEIVLHNLRFVVSVAARYQNRGLPLDDIVQEGAMGLLRAIAKFDYRKGFKFSTYAMTWVRQSILRAFIERGSRPVRLPVHRHEHLARMLRTEERLMQELEREPTDEELGGATGLAADVIAGMRRSLRTPKRLDMAVGEDLDNSLIDIIVDEDSEPVEDAGLRGPLGDVMQEALSHLQPREREVLMRRFGDGCTLHEAGAGTGLSRERIRQIERMGLTALRRYGDAHDMAEWL